MIKVEGASKSFTKSQNQNFSVVLFSKVPPGVKEEGASFMLFVVVDLFVDIIMRYPLIICNPPTCLNMTKIIFWVSRDQTFELDGLSDLFASNGRFLGPQLVLLHSPVRFRFWNFVRMRCGRSDQPEQDRKENESVEKSERDDQNENLWRKRS